MKELAEQAYRLTVLASQSELHRCALGSDYFVALEKAKFAKLIVEECCKQLEKEQYEHFNINRVPRTFYNAALYDGIITIKKHFGVEE